MKRARRLTKRERKAEPDGGSFTNRFLFARYGGGRSSKLQYLATRMSPTYERNEWFRLPGPVYGWFDISSPGQLDWHDNANDYSPQPPEEMDDDGN